MNMNKLLLSIEAIIIYPEVNAQKLLDAALKLSGENLKDNKTEEKI